MNTTSTLRKAAAIVSVLSVALLAAPTFAAGDITPPTVTNVTSSAADGNYVTGQVIPFQISFSEPVIVTGTSVWLQLASGSSTNFAARYVSGSGTDTITLNYTVQATDHATHLDYKATNSFLVLLSTVKDAAGNKAIQTLAAPGAAGSLGANKSISLN